MCVSEKGNISIWNYRSNKEPTATLTTLDVGLLKPLLWAERSTIIYHQQNASSALTSFLMKYFIHPYQFIRLLLRHYFAFLIKVTLNFCNTDIELCCTSQLTSFSSFKSLNINGMQEPVAYFEVLGCVCQSLGFLHLWIFSIPNKSDTWKIFKNVQLG